ncbi:MAG: helix-turn-helix transcriptional regulator [Alphaproteobacteria bacterium]|nr:helix-turn-helix transcriptional regulator [Alphaproteobacteria bacterium]MDD9919583.1 helix-turn-helix transcriptional regulator [Alphaproteobacteria bacterium]
MTVSKPNPVDIHVGKRLKQRRTLLGVSQEKLADALGITFQQVQKYENGSNRVGASRLFQIGRVLEVPVSFFFDGYAPKSSASIAEDTPSLEEDLMARRETLTLVRSYYAIENEKVRKKVLDMIKSMAAEAAEEN